MKKMTIDLKVGDMLEIGSTTVRLEKKSGQIARLVIEATSDTIIKNPQETRRSASTHLEGALHHGKHPI